MTDAEAAAIYEAAQPAWLTEPDTESVKALEAGLARLKKEGWGRGKFHDQSTGKLDALGALGAPFGYDRPQAVAYLAYAIRTGPVKRVPEVRDDQECVILFNDGWRRKFSEVEAVYERAINLARGAGVHVRG